MPSLSLLAVRDLTIAFPVAGSWRPVVRGVSLAVERGEIFGLVGESGSGKTLTALAILGLLPANARVTSGRIELAGPEGAVDLLTLGPRELRRVRGGRIGLVFQEPATAMNPAYTLGFQIAEAVRAHRDLPRREAREEAVRLLDLVALADARRRLGRPGCWTGSPSSPATPGSSGGKSAAPTRWATSMSASSVRAWPARVDSSTSANRRAPSSSSAPSLPATCKCACCKATCRFNAKAA